MRTQPEILSRQGRLKTESCLAGKAQTRTTRPNGSSPDRSGRAETGFFRGYSKNRDKPAPSSLYLSASFSSALQSLPQTPTYLCCAFPPTFCIMSSTFHDAPTVEYTPISTIRASTPLYVQNITQNLVFGRRVYGEGCYL